MNILLRVYAFILLLIGVALIGGGGCLLALHGSPYYLLSGLAFCASGFLLWRRRGESIAVYSVLWLATVIWALWEAGIDGWALVPRLLVPTVLGLVFLLPAVRRRLTWNCTVPSWWVLVGACTIAVIAGVLLRRFVPQVIAADPIYRVGTVDVVADPATSSHADAGAEDWPYYGKDPGGTRFSGLTQITPGNVKQLELAWSYRIDSGPGEATPLKIDRMLYFCSNRNGVAALDAESGREIWRFTAHVDPRLYPNGGYLTCRGVSHYRAPARSGACAARIVATTADAKLLALDAQDGKPCIDFGVRGEVSLLGGMGDVKPDEYHVTSPAMIIAGKIVLGGEVWDNQSWGAPSGVIRAFDAVTGQLAWAWDMGHPERTDEPPEGETYTRSTPNSWGAMSADETLGLVFVPTGNVSGADYFGGHRRPFDDRSFVTTLHFRNDNEE